jgi:uncharacterized protein (DUF1697 family)
MADLAAIFAAVGCTGTRTYIQSGNVVYCASPSVAPRVPRLVADSISRKHGLKVPVIIRTAAELDGAVRGNPFLEESDVSAVHVGFLAALPETGRVRSLDPDRSPGDSFRIRGREIYLHLPNGVARTRLTNAWFDSALGTVSTFRNWRTVMKLHEMARQSAVAQ